jgi:hypothetical protein
MESVTFNPFAAIQKAAKGAHLRINFDSAHRFHRVDGRCLIRDRTDTADPGGDIGRFGEFSAAQKSFKKSGRFKYSQLNIRYFAIRNFYGESSLSFHPREIIHFYRSMLHAIHFLFGIFLP